MSTSVSLVLTESLCDVRKLNYTSWEEKKSKNVLEHVWERDMNLLNVHLVYFVFVSLGVHCCCTECDVRTIWPHAVLPDAVNLEPNPRGMRPQSIRKV